MKNTIRILFFIIISCLYIVDQVFSIYTILFILSGIGIYRLHYKASQTKSVMIPIKTK